MDGKSHRELQEAMSDMERLRSFKEERRFVWGLRERGLGSVVHGW